MFVIFSAAIKPDTLKKSKYEGKGSLASYLESQLLCPTHYILHAQFALQSNDCLKIPLSASFASKPIHPVHTSLSAQKRPKISSQQHAVKDLQCLRYSWVEKSINSSCTYLLHYFCQILPEIQGKGSVICCMLPGSQENKVKSSAGKLKDSRKKSASKTLSQRWRLRIWADCWTVMESPNPASKIMWADYF